MYVELNPGPVNCETCSICHTETVPIKLKVCNCGYIFHKTSHRKPPMASHPASSQPVAFSNVEVVNEGNPTSTNQVQSQPIGDDKSLASHVEVGNKTVTDDDPGVSIVEAQSLPVAGKSVTSLKW